jgi:hypothetical protein
MPACREARVRAVESDTFAKIDSALARTKNIVRTALEGKSPALCSVNNKSAVQERVWAMLSGMGSRRRRLL